MDLNRAAIFASVVDANGFTAAARKLRLPKTTVSKRVSDLEAELGIRLLNRTTRSLSLTEAGAKLYAHCRQALQTMEIAEREVQALQSEPEGLLRIGAPSAIGVRFLLPLIADLMLQYPALRISLIAINDDSGLDDDQLDVLIWPGIAPIWKYTARPPSRPHWKHIRWSLSPSRFLAMGSSGNCVTAARKLKWSPHRRRAF
jgi:LysR family transcriptional regulator, regulator for bpeEF and oprC